jgi:hypothetical protein
LLCCPLTVAKSTVPVPTAACSGHSESVSSSSSDSPRPFHRFTFPAMVVEGRSVGWPLCGVDQHPRIDIGVWVLCKHTTVNPHSIAARTSSEQIQLAHTIQCRCVVGSIEVNMAVTHTRHSTGHHPLLVPLSRHARKLNQFQKVCSVAGCNGDLKIRYRMQIEDANQISPPTATRAHTQSLCSHSGCQG